MADGEILLDLGERPESFRRLFSVRPFVVLFGAEIQSLVGDQLARVALTILVFQRTGNAAATALTYAATYVPAILGGFVVAGLGDRWSRLGVMITCDLTRAGLFVLMAMHNVPLGLMVVLLVIAVFFEPAFSAAQFAYLAAMLSEEQMRSATGVRMAAMQAAQVAGFALGGLVVVLVSARGALIVDAVTFVISALAVGSVARANNPTPQPAVAPVDDTSQSDEDRRGSAAWLLGDKPTLVVAALIVLVGLFVVPEGLAVPYTGELHQSTAIAGLLLASMPLGGAIGAVLLVRFAPDRHRRPLASMMVVLCGVPLLITALRPPWPVAFVAWLVSGAFAAYQVEMISELSRRVPDGRRSGVMGVIGGCLTAAQGLAISAFGGVGELLSPSVAIALAGLVGIVLALATVRIRSRVDNRGGRHRRSAGRSRSEFAAAE